MLSLSYFMLAVVSALVPWVNGEIVMLSAVPLAKSQMQLAWLVVMVVAGQMAGKTVMYWISRKASDRRLPVLQRAVERWRVRFERSPSSALGLTLVSSAVGFPSFYLVSMAAGALRVAFGPFLLVGTIGRLIHFALVAVIPQLAGRS